MTRNTLRQKIRILLLAAAAGAMMHPAVIRAEDHAYVDDTPEVYTGLPEIEIDGSVLEHLGKNAPATADAQPVRLIPPPEMEVLSLPEFHAKQKNVPGTRVPMLTAIAGETAPAPAKIPEFVPAKTAARPLPTAKVAIPPVIREISAPVKKPDAIVLAPEKQKTVVQQSAKLAAKPAPTAPGYKPEIPVNAAALKVDVQEKPEQVVSVASEDIKNESDLKLSTRTVHSLIEEITSTPLSKASTGQDTEIKPAPAAPVAAVADERRDEIIPPRPGDKMTGSRAFEGIKPPEQGTIALFPVKMKVRGSAVLDPSANKPAVVAVASEPAEPFVPEEPDVKPVAPETESAPVPVKIAAAAPEKTAIKIWNTAVPSVEPVILGPEPVFVMPEQPRVKTQDSHSLVAEELAPPPAPVVVAAAPVVPKEVPPEEWRQENPASVIRDAPVPGRRPDKQMASQEFVQQARRTVFETYTVMRNDGVPIPAVARADVSKDKLAPMRMSVADLANDPLASQILDMSPAEVAATLNKMTPAAGRSLSREINAVSRPRIIRQEGERIFKSRKSLEPVYEAQPATTTENSIAETPMALPAAPALASVPEAKTIAAERRDLALPFPAGNIDLPEDAKASMDNGVIPLLKSREGMRVQIIAFASPTGGKEASARRTALSRALAVRSYLISQGVDATRMDVRAPGVQTDPQAAKDKVDLHLMMPEKG